MWHFAGLTTQPLEVHKGQGNPPELVSKYTARSTPGIRQHGSREAAQGIPAQQRASVWRRSRHLTCGHLVLGVGWQNTPPTLSPVLPRAAPSCPAPASAQPLREQWNEGETRGQGEAAALVIRSRKRQPWHPGRQPVLARGPDQAFRPRSSDKVQITDVQLWAAEPLRAFQRPGGCPPSLCYGQEQTIPRP